MRTYITLAVLAFGLFGYAQLRGWSLFPSEAQQFQRERAAEAQEREFARTGRGRTFSGK